ncbi:MAG TPA: TadE family protein [Sphingomonas sp.]|nr:TadE family protein [Sphingomonas sp.]
MAEFAVLAPTMLLLIMGSMDLAYRGFVTSVLEGEMQKAARDSGLEDQNPDKLATIEAKVKTQVGRVVKNASFGQLRKSYTSYLNAKPERFTDSNNNGQRDAGECFDDVNANGQWDPDPGRDGQGGANDVTVYSMTLTYPRLFPMYRMLGWPQNEVITARTYLKNQPYKTQTAPVVNTICT